MTCNDCLHAEVCGTFAIASETFEISSPERTASSCNDFKDRSRFVELPYKIGDKAFRVAGNGEIEEGEVRGFFFGAGGQTLEIVFSTEPEHCGVINEAFVKKTRKEAEQALKEREEK